LFSAHFIRDNYRKISEMKKNVFFENKTYKILLIIYLLIVLMNNLYLLLFVFPKGWIAVLLNGIILIFVLTKNINLKLILKIWSFIFLILASAMQIVAKIVKELLDNNYQIEWDEFIRAVIFLVIGFLIFYFSKTVIVKETQ